MKSYDSRNHSIQKHLAETNKNRHSELFVTFVVLAIVYSILFFLAQIFTGV